MNCKDTMQLSDELPQMAPQVTGFLKGLANEHRLLILCNLVNGPRSVTELIEATGIAQTSMSQHLAKLKDEGIVKYERDHRTLYYSIAHPAVTELMNVLYDSFCTKCAENKKG